MSIRPIARDFWSAELDSFSRRHEGWLVSIKTRTSKGDSAIEVHDLPLQGVSLMSHGASDIAVAVGDTERHFEHDIHDVVAVCLDQTAEEAQRALIIDARDGSTTTIEFRSPMRAEEVDGLPAAPR